MKKKNRGLGMKGKENGGKYNNSRTKTWVDG